MQKQQLSPKANLSLSNIVLGLWRLNDVPAREISSLIHDGLDLGITSIDEADIYGNYQSQKYFGRVLKEEPSLREKLEIVSKTAIVLPGSPSAKKGLGYYVTTENHIVHSVEQTLKDLNTHYLDLLLIHRPSPLMHPEMLDRTFHKLLKSGKVLHFGVSNFTPSQFEMLSERMETPLITNQIEWSVLHVDPIYDGTLDTCIKNQIKPMIWSPLAGGSLFSGQSERAQKVRKVMNEISAELGDPPLDQVALAWLLKHPSGPIPVIGTFQKERVLSAAKAMQLELTDEQWFQILVASQGHPMP
ncbi:MAG: hypothetical protein A2W95_08130 [Bacteroidetes bacterium GWA2_40_14]|jgi:predicted oxidoreductase|nr:MAG: hypothetical protein A2W95_08130 [Bacteroidetes bacterium GWA2_40_14]